MESGSTASASGFGQSSNLFIENNNITVTTPTNSGVGCTDGWGTSASVVVRYNTAVNCRWLIHGAGDGGGPRNFEAYNNNTTWNANSGGAGGIQGCYRAFHDQGGGTLMAFNNSCIPFGSLGLAGVVYQDFRSCSPNSCGEGAGPPSCDGTVSGGTYPGTTYTKIFDGNRSGANGYPCWHQPGRDDSLNLHTIGFWNNTTIGGALLSMVYDSAAADEGKTDYSSSHDVYGRDYVVGGAQQSNSTTPFNGSSGMGWGTLPGGLPPAPR